MDGMNRLMARLAILAAAVVVTLTATAVPVAATTWTDVFIQTNTGTPRCVYAPNASSGTQMVANSCVDDANELWTATPVGAYYTIVNVGTGLCLSNGGTLTGAPVVQQACVAGATWAQWQLTGSGHTFQVRNRGANLCMVPQNATVGSPIILVACASGQQWQFLF